MTSKFCSLTAGKGYVAAFTALDADRKAAAEREADAAVDDALDGFDVELWTPDTTPAEIRTAADKLAAARFLRLEASRFNTVAAADAESLPATLEKEARRTLDDIASRGWYRADDGRRVERCEEDRSPFTFEIRR